MKNNPKFTTQEKRQWVLDALTAYPEGAERFTINAIIQRRFDNKLDRIPRSLYRYMERDGLLTRNEWGNVIGYQATTDAQELNTATQIERRGRPRVCRPARQVTLRLPQALLDRVGAYQRTLPGTTRTDAICVLLEKGLEA